MAIYSTISYLNEGAASCANIHLPMKKNCNANIGDLSVKEKWGCETTYTIVAGQYEVIDKIAAYLSYLDPGVDEAKAQIDHIIDLCGEKPSGKHFSSITPLISEECSHTPIIFDKERFISNVFETSQFLRKIKQLTSYLLKN